MPDQAPPPEDPHRAAGPVVFIYFRSSPNDRDAVRTAHARLALALREAGLPTGDGLALRRESAREPLNGEAPGYLTWLETYRVTDLDAVHAQLAALDRLAGDCGLSALALNGRHTEIFEPCA